PARLEMRKLAKLIDERQQRIGMEAELALLARRVDLNIDVERPAFPRKPPVEQLRQPQAVERMELAGDAGEIFSLVALQMSDDAPVDGKVVAGRAYGHPYLQLVLAKDALPRRTGESQGRRWRRLGDRQQPHLGTFPSGARAGIRNAGLDRGQIGAKGRQR